MNGKSPNVGFSKGASVGTNWAVRRASAFSALVVFILLQTRIALPQEVPKQLADWWRAHAPVCLAPDGFKFPAKQVDGQCDDGDATLFAGLLCASGETIGCDAVKRSQDPTGRWFRSPRRSQSDNLGEPNSFSPDMALGVQLYVGARSDKDNFGKWLNWLDAHRTCWIGGGDNCVRSVMLRFCTDDTQNGCTLRPGDGAMLDATTQKLDVYPPSQDVRYLLHQMGINRFDILFADSQFNKPGFSQHLVAVEIYLLRLLGYSDPRLIGAAFALAQKQPNNPFFLYLSEGRTAKVLDLTLNLCPSPTTGLPAKMAQWAWEREDGDQAWKESMLWDCIFMARLLGEKP